MIIIVYMCIVHKLCIAQNRTKLIHLFIVYNQGRIEREGMQLSITPEDIEIFIVTKNKHQLNSVYL